MSQAEFAQLASRAKDGLIKRSDVGSFIAENLLNDPKSIHTTALLANDLLAFVETIAPAWMKRPLGSGEDTSTAHRELEEKYTKLLGEGNLVGSAGEFGLLFALLANRPDAKELDGEPTVPLRDVEAMFLEKRLPDGWRHGRNPGWTWLKNTTGLLISAGKKYWFLKRQL